MQVLAPDARKVHSGELNATPFVQEEPGELTCPATGETYNPKTHVHCPLTFVTLDKQRYNGFNGAKAVKAKGKNKGFPGGKTWKAHLADMRALFNSDESVLQRLRSRLAQLAPVAGVPSQGEGGLVMGYTDLVSISSFEGVIEELGLVPTSEHLITWRALVGPSVKPEQVH